MYTQYQTHPLSRTSGLFFAVCVFSFSCSLAHEIIFFFIINGALYDNASTIVYTLGEKNIFLAWIYYYIQTSTKHHKRRICMTFTFLFSFLFGLNYKWKALNVRWWLICDEGVGHFPSSWWIIFQNKQEWSHFAIVCTFSCMSTVFFKVLRLNLFCDEGFVLQYLCTFLWNVMRHEDFFAQIKL